MVQSGFHYGAMVQPLYTGKMVQVRLWYALHMVWPPMVHYGTASLLLWYISILVQTGYFMVGALWYGRLTAVGHYGTRWYSLLTAAGNYGTRWYRVLQEP